MEISCPRPLEPGMRIGVTAPSSGVDEGMWPRLDVAVEALHDKGFEVVLGECLGTPSHVSAPRAARADELMSMLVDPDIAAVVPPWGGETGIDVLPLLDFDLLAASEPCWYVGFSDTSTTMLPLTLRSGWATLHGWNLMGTPYAAAPGLAHWLDVAMAPAEREIVQRAATHCRASGWDDYRGNPSVSRQTLDVPTRWRGLREDDNEVTFSGRLVGGCLEVLSPLAGSPYGDIPNFVANAGDSGVILCLEVCEWGPFDVARALHGMALCGWFDGLSGVLIGRTPAPDAAGWTQRDALLDVLGELSVPVIADVDFGHTQPSMSLINGLVADVTMSDAEQSIGQRIS